ncbi:hypothetical protein PROFUN_01490 [Planoprotostelium fungivorum]|uniref:Uncharacterized protein n=1 Tax=Planoprotostelium fungivorum TaxID=1890364 RepID=A0A2P6NTN8_9EUKA|nr:hypothetical protein PROFUN_01490 [Planoprotostelium fungivorum]
MPYSKPHQSGMQAIAKMVNNTQERFLYIMRGCPGSGKSTLSKEILSAPGHEQGTIFSTDDYFSESGEYKFNPSELPKAHLWNQNRCREAMEKGDLNLFNSCLLIQGITPIIVDNTNVMRWEAKTYVQLANKHQYTVIVSEPQTEWWTKKDVDTMAKLNKHHVPADVITRMLQKWEDDFTVENILRSQPPFQKRTGRKTDKLHAQS